MSNARSIWSAAPPAVKQGCPNANLVSSFSRLTLDQQQSQQQQQQQTRAPTLLQIKGAVPAGHRCNHGKWQPEPAETTEAKKYTCYECTFVCSKCGENSVGLCDSYECS